MDFVRRSIDALRSALAKRAGLLRVLALVGAAVAVGAVVPNPVEACGISDPISCVAMIFVKIFQLLTALMGWILVLEVEALIRVAQYFNFVSPGPTAVQIGWVVTRDLANMFFIVVLLIIAFGTILGSSTYHYSKNLPRLLIMAVVINFSKTICGIFIDMGQVVMLTFVNGFKETAAGNFMNAYQINKLLALGNATGDNSYNFGMVVAMMFAFILAAISVCVTLVLLVVILFRVVMLWILIILSPIAFLTSAIPKGGDYYAQWWKEFKKYIITGPIIAFFMWLALASVQQVGPGGFAGQGFPATYAGQGERQAIANSAAVTSGSRPGSIPTEAGTADTIMNMVIAICIMFAGLKYATDSGVAGAGFAKTMRGGLEKTGRAILSKGAGGAARTALQPILGMGGRGLAKVPLVGGLGRAAVLQSEKWKKERQSGLEKRFGSQEDFARLSPGAFKRSMSMQMAKPFKDDVDKKRLDSMLRTGLATPAIAKSMGDGTGASALNTIIGRSKGKGLQDAVGLMMSDKNANAWAKDPEKPALLADTYEKIKSEWKDKDGNVLDPNMGKTVSDFEQKFAPQLISNGLMDASRLKDIAPKMSTEDVAGLAKGDIGTFMPYLAANQMKKLATDGKPDQHEAMLESFKGMDATQRKDVLGKLGAGDIPASWYAEADVADSVLDRTKGDPKTRGEVMTKGGGALTARADQRLQDALRDNDPAKFVAALPDAISVGTLSASTISSDAKLQAAIKQNANQIDLQAVGRNVSVSDAGKTEAGKALASLISDVNPDKVKNARKGGMNDHILPTTAEMDAKKADTEAKATQARNDTRDVYVAQAVSGALADAIAGQVSQLRSVGADDQAEALNKKFKEVADSTEKLKQSQESLAQTEQRLQNTAGMTIDQIGALKGAADGLKRRVDELKTSVAKAAADVKGEKFDTGEKNRRPGGGGRRA